jgi:hypothetical protein
MSVPARLEAIESALSCELSCDSDIWSTSRSNYSESRVRKLDQNWYTSQNFIGNKFSTYALALSTIQLPRPLFTRATRPTTFEHEAIILCFAGTQICQFRSTVSARQIRTSVRLPTPWDEGGRAGEDDSCAF